MIVKNLKKSMRLLSFSSHSFGVGYLDYKDDYYYYDFLATDIDHNDLNGDISDKLDKKYLSPLSSKDKEF